MKEKALTLKLKAREKKLNHLRSSIIQPREESNSKFEEKALSLKLKTEEVFLHLKAEERRLSKMLLFRSV